MDVVKYKLCVSAGFGGQGLLQRRCDQSREKEGFLLFFVVGGFSVFEKGIEKDGSCWGGD